MAKINCEQTAIRNFLKARACYEVLPLSFRLIELDVSLTVKESLNILVQNGGYIYYECRADIDISQALFQPRSGTQQPQHMPAYSR